MMDRIINEDATEKRRVTHINAHINMNINDQKEGLEASERMFEGREYVERWKIWWKEKILSLAEVREQQLNPNVEGDDEHTCNWHTMLAFRV